MNKNTPPPAQLPFDTVIFDLDGVVTKTALVHAAAWKEMFDEYMKVRAERNNEQFQEFTHENDYLPYVDGKPRYKGVQSFLESRGIHIPFGVPEDDSDQETVCGLGNRKNIKFREVLNEKGVEVYPSTIALIHDLRAQGVRVGVASSSKNCQFVLQAAEIEPLFEVRIDGVVSTEMGLKGKPEADIFVVAAKKLGSDPDRALVVEDAVSGVQAGRNGAFALVVGLARENNEKELSENGADVVITDFEGVLTDQLVEWVNEKQVKE